MTSDLHKACRRSRLHRKSTGQAIALTPRDLEVFKILNRYRYLRSNFIHAFVGGNKIALIKRLGVLYHEGYLDRPAQQWQAINARYMPAVYELGTKATQTLRANGISVSSVPSRLYQHSIMVCDILASMELAVRAAPSLRLVPWEEIAGKLPESTRNRDNPLELPCSISFTFSRSATIHHSTKAVVPDAVFGIEYIPSRSYRFFALEADRNNEPVFRNDLSQTSYLRKVLQYREIAKGAYKTHWGLPNLLVLTVTTSSAHMDNILTLVRDLCGEKGASYLLFKTMPSLASLERAPSPDTYLLTAPWQRAGHEPFEIHKP
ncbi:replication-relaxation family protein [Bradyrhizobium acaciae]|uniref:replication-relaxation family protein n=1 Tax=Bradyrhizobium acaciae TaxID=2683706 RepID=UPI001E57D50F|nr:replication-relaxation family protein [Bradyrhizobium acaciae]MCC8977578.1 replication-relaxation family protein [Bradyrhizobium acaciae]